MLPLSPLHEETRTVYAAGAGRGSGHSQTRSWPLSAGLSHARVREERSEQVSQHSVARAPALSHLSAVEASHSQWPTAKVYDLVKPW